MFNAHKTAIGEAMPEVRFPNTIPGLVDLYLSIDTIGGFANTPDHIMNSITDTRGLIMDEIMRRPARDDLDVAAKLRLAAHLISDPDTIWLQEAELINDAVSRLSSLRTK